VTSDETFLWHPNARLFSGAGQIGRPPEARSAGYCGIAALPQNQALVALGAAVQARQSFCIHDASPAAGLFAPQDHFLTLTGGSSGSPKAILRRQQSWIQSFLRNAATFSYGAQDAIAVLGQLSHSLTLYGVLEALHLGLDAHVLGNLAPAQQRQRIAASRVSVLYLTPTQLRVLARDPAAHCLPDVRLILCGGGTLDTATRESGHRLCPNAEILVFYGAAETSFITCSTAQTPEGSVGQAYPGVTLRIMDSRGVETQGVGEVWVRSPYLFEGYAAGHSAQTQWRDGYLTVGELGQLDGQGNLWLKGRKTRMITIADQNVFPEEVEAVILAIDGIAQCAVIPVADALRGHRLIAVIGAADGHDQLSDISAICKAALGPMSTPKKVLFHPDFPMLASGKADLSAITQWVETQI